MHCHFARGTMWQCIARGAAPQEGDKRSPHPSLAIFSGTPEDNIVAGGAGFLMKTRIWREVRDSATPPLRAAHFVATRCPGHAFPLRAAREAGNALRGGHTWSTSLFRRSDSAAREVAPKCDATQRTRAHVAVGAGPAHAFPLRAAHFVATRCPGHAFPLRAAHYVGNALPA